MTDRDISVLNFINLVGMCRTEHIRKLFFNGLTNTTWDRRANKLVEYKELKRFRSGIYNREYVYYIENKPNERILRHDMYITELVYKLLLLGVEVLYLDRNIKLGNIISDGYMIIRYKKNNTIIKRGILIEVQLHGRLSDCVDKYADVESIKEYVINQGMQTLPSLLVISDLTGKIRNKILKVINIDCGLDCVSECIL